MGRNAKEKNTINHKQNHTGQCLINRGKSNRMIGVNFSVFGRRDLSYNAVKSQQQAGNENLLVSVSQDGDHINAWYLTDVSINHPKLEIYDILGRFITSCSQEHAEQGWNSMTCPVNQLGSGTYICRVSGSGFTRSRTFQIVK